MSIIEVKSKKLIKELSNNHVKVEFTGKTYYGVPLYVPGEKEAGILDVPPLENGLIREKYCPFSLMVNNRFEHKSEYLFHSNEKYNNHILFLKSQVLEEIKF